MKEYLINYLKEKSLKYEDVSNELLHFETNGHDYLAIMNEDADHYIRLTLPNLEKADGLLLDDWKMITELNSHYRVAKVIIVDDFVWISCEFFCPNPTQLKELLDIFIIILDKFYIDYAKYRKEHAAERVE